MFVEELVDLLEVIYKKQSVNDSKTRFHYLQNFKFIDDFEKGRFNRNPTKSCREDDLVFIAIALMHFDPLASHLAVVDSLGNLVGITSQRDMLTINLADNTEREGNLQSFNEHIKNIKISDGFITPRDKLVALPLDKKPEISEVLDYFAPEKGQRRPIGVVVVTKTKDSFTKGDYDLLSYVDVLKNFKNYACYQKLKDVPVSSRELKLGSENDIVVLHPNDGLALVGAALLTEQVRSIPVVNDKQEFVGLITDKDYSLRVSVENLEKPVKEFMRKKDEVPVLNRNQTFEQLVELFAENREYTTLPLLTPDNKTERLIGYTDLLRKMKENW